MAYIILILSLTLASCAQFYTTKTATDKTEAAVMIRSVSEELKGSFHK